MNANRIRWPCEGLPYSKTVRAKLYGDLPMTRAVGWAAVVSFALCFDLTHGDHLGSLSVFGVFVLVLVPWYIVLKLTQGSARKKDARLARRAFEPWRKRWSEAEAAALTFAESGPQQLEAAFVALPVGLHIIYQRTEIPPNTWKRVAALPPLASSTLRRLDLTDRGLLSRYASLSLCYLAWSWARMHGVVLRPTESSVACYWQPAPSLHYFVYARAVLVPGGASIEIEDGYEFWIPRGAKVRRIRHSAFADNFLGEVKSFRVKSEFWNSFVKGFSLTQWGQDYSDPTAVTTDRLREFMLLPECGDSVDLRALYAARPASISLNEVMTQDGRPLFSEAEAEMQAFRESIERSLSPAFDAARRRLEVEVAHA